MISVLLVDDQSMVRSGLRALLSAEPDLVVVGEALDGAVALELSRRLHQDVVVMDIRMPILDGVVATRRLAADPELGEVRILVLTTYDDDELIFRALGAGAGGFLLKDAEPEDLVNGIRVLASGEGLLAPSVTRRLVEAFVARPEPSAPRLRMVDAITERELEDRHARRNRPLQRRDRRQALDQPGHGPHMSLVSCARPARGTAPS